MGQDSDHGLAAIERTVDNSNPHGLAFKFVKILSIKHKPCDASAEIALSAELRSLQFKMANDYYNDVVSVLARYNLKMSETDLIKFLAERIKDNSYAKMIIDHLKQPKINHSLEELCTEIAEVQWLSKAFSANSSNSKGQKEVSLTNAESKNGGKKNGSEKKSEGGKTEKTCNHCGKEGHLEKHCWQKNPDKAPKWVKEKAAKKESKSSTVNAEVTLCDFELSDGVYSGEFSAVEVNASFDILRQAGCRICDTGASCHSTNSIAGSKNVEASGSESIGHAGKALKSMKSIDIPGQFVKSDGTLGLTGTLTEVNYHKELNFNLLSLSRLLKQGWYIT